MANWTDVQALKFADAVQSLKLYRRAEVFKAGTNQSIIEQLYVDPLPNEAVLRKILNPTTTFIVGRKGTGKSTVFQRAQFEIRKKKDVTSAYVDIKTVYESSEIDQGLVHKIASNEYAFSAQEAQRLLLYRSFIQAVFRDVKVEIRKQLEGSWSASIWESFTGQRQDVLESIDDIIDAAFEGDFVDITGIKPEKSKTKKADKKSKSGSTSVKLNINAKVESISAGSEIKNQSGWSNEGQSAVEHEFARVLMRLFNINDVIKQLDDVLKSIGIRHLYIFIDDFSELPAEAMSVFVDTILAPLNNWSNELIKFKVAAYPGRVYYGKIDKMKMDEIHLDLYKLYGSSDVSSMEERATDFTTRLIANRIKYHCKIDVENFIDSSSSDDVYRQLFFATSGNPRILGHILGYLYDSQIAYGKTIGLRSILEASIKYYEEKVEPFFGIQKFRHETLAERASTFSLKELLESIIDRSRELRSYKRNAILAGVPGRPPTSHFHVVSDLESLLSTLELNFFLTKYFEMKDKDGRVVSLFALNYGLCGKYQISFGRPEGKREYRYYYVERVFDYTTILRRFLQLNQEIRCQECSEVHGLDMLGSIQAFDMLCPKCKKGTCLIVNLSKKYEKTLNSIKPELLLPETELGILDTLFIENDLAAGDIAGELDCSYQLVGKRGKIMEDRGLVKRIMVSNKRRFSLTKQAIRDYFDDNDDRKLDVHGSG